MSQAHRSISMVHSAVIDRRAHNIRYRQNELQKLHTQLREHSQELLDAVAKDADMTQTEARAQFIQTMDSISENYARLDNKSAHKEEYSIAFGRSNIGRRAPYGLVVMKPCTFTRLYSIIQPLSAAISSGNCAIIELPNTGLAVDSLLKSIIRSSLDQEAYLILESNFESSEYPAEVLLIDQAQTSTHIGPCLCSLSNARTLAIVDRTAHLSEAAESIAHSRLLFSGKSPYAPDLILVNEFVKAPFVEALVKAINAFAAARSPAKGADRDTTVTLKTLKMMEEAGDCSTLHSSTALLAEVHNRDSALLGDRILGRCIMLLSIRSLTDATIIQRKFPNLLAGYYFGNDEAGKFLSQSMSAEASFVNHIPGSLLVGPAAPSGYPVCLTSRYTSEMLTRPHPEYARCDNQKEARISKGLAQNDSNIFQNVVQPLKPTGQKSGTSIGFFDQGILTGLTFFVLPVLATTCYLTYLGGRFTIAQLSGLR